MDNIHSVYLRFRNLNFYTSSVEIPKTQKTTRNLTINSKLP